jgi:hypothetical protein
MIFVSCDMAEDPRAVGRGPQHEIDVAGWPLDAGVCERIVEQAQRELAEEMYEAWGIAAKRIGDAEAVAQVAEMPEFADILGATPYALRRGGISLRLRAEDPQTVAKECGTSLKMLSAHYAFAIDDLRRFEPRPVDVEWRAARAAQVEGQTQEQAPLDGPDREDRRGRRKVFGWFATRRWATRVS